MNPDRPRPTILGLAAATPELVLDQRTCFDSFYAPLYVDVPGAAQLFASTRVRRRHFAWDPRIELADGSPPTSRRMAKWEEEALALGRQAVAAALGDHDRARVGTFVMASCTGYAGPTPDIRLAEALGLRRDLRRAFIGHMGCCAAFNALRVALDAVAARPDELAVVYCCELASVHIRLERSREQAVIHALFGDAGAALVLGDAPAGAGPQILHSGTETCHGTAEAMTWRVLDDGFRMTLSPRVPELLGAVIEPFVARLLAPAGLRREDVRHWCIHPGGPRIVASVAAHLALSTAQTRASLHVLAEYGNCSSATVLLVLADLLAVDRPRPGEYGVMMAFGPGLTIEALLLRF